MRGPIRRITDQMGTRWTVRAEWRPEVVLAIAPGCEASRCDRLWLYFRSPGVTRRIGTFPAEWFDLDETALQDLLQRSVRRR